MLRSVNALDFIPGLVLTYMTFVLPFTIWTLRGFVEGVPVELEEAALVDGCSRIKAFTHVLLPLLGRATATSEVEKKPEIKRTKGTLV